MDFILDLRTISLLTALFSFTYGIGLLLFQREQQLSLGLQPFIYTFMTIGCGTMLISFRGFISDGLSIIVANLLICTGFVLALYSFSLFRQAKSINILIAFLSLPFVAISLLYFTYQHPSMNTRIVIVSLQLAMVMFMSGYNIYKGKANDLVLPTRLLSVVFTAVGLSMLLRGLIVLKIPIIYHYLVDSWLHQLGYVSGIFNIIAMVFGLIWLINGRLVTTLENLSFRDSLTSLYNRRGLIESVEKTLKESKKKQSPLTILMCDIDHFKMINDNHGHVIGDYAIQDVAFILKAQLKENDLAFRYGGEEFLVLLPHCDEQEGLRIAEQIRSHIECNQLERMKGLGLTISIGLTQYQVDESFDRAVSRADAALYQAKSQGRNRVISNTEINSITDLSSTITSL